MALTATITKGEVDKVPGHNDFNASINVVVINESAEVLLEKNYSERYNSDTPLETIKQDLQNKFVADWNKRKSELEIKDAAAFDTLVSELQVAANTFINS